MTGYVLLVIWLLVIISLWGFAFLPNPEISPEWLVRSQAVCFGTNENGLPGPQGWMLLIMGPLSLLVFMSFSHSRELAGVPRLIQSSRPLKILSMVLFTALAIETHFVSRRIVSGIRASQVSFESIEKGALPSDYPRGTNPVSAFTLVDQEGKAFSHSQLSGKITLLTFAYAHCATVCPVLVHNVLEAQKRLVAGGIDSVNVNAVFITLDPWRDTPSTLPQRAKTWRMGENSYLLSGKVPDVQKTLKDFGVPFERDLKTGEISHPAQVMIVDKEGKIAYSFLNPSVDWLMTAAERLSR